jgi:hypothetical protein
MASTTRRVEQKKSQQQHTPRLKLVDPQTASQPIADAFGCDL